MVWIFKFPTRIICFNTELFYNTSALKACCPGLVGPDLREPREFHPTENAITTSIEERFASLGSPARHWGRGQLLLPGKHSSNSLASLFPFRIASPPRRIDHGQKFFNRLLTDISPMTFCQARIPDMPYSTLYFTSTGHIKSSDLSISTTDNNRRKEPNTDL